MKLLYGKLPSTSRAKNERRAAISRRVDVSPPTLPQTIVLLALSRGTQPRPFPPITRRELLRKRWISPVVREITDDGRRALATSPHLSAALRVLDDRGGA